MGVCLGDNSYPQIFLDGDHLGRMNRLFYFFLWICKLVVKMTNSFSYLVYPNNTRKLMILVSVESKIRSIVMWVFNLFV